MPRVACPYCDEAVRFISRDTLPDIFRKHLVDGEAHDPHEDFEDLDRAVRSALSDLEI
jgi:hypothetical protein